MSATQQSQSDACHIEEGWAKKVVKKERDETELLDLMRRKRLDYFAGWKQGDIASFLTNEYFIEHKMRIDRSAVSRIFTEKQKPVPPGKDRCDILREVFYNLLPKRTVDNEQKLIGFRMLPISARRVDDLIRNPTEIQMEPNTISTTGDARVKLSDMQRLIRPEQSLGAESTYWISDEVVNAMTSLYGAMETKQRIFFFNSLMIQKVLSAQEDDQLSRILRGNDITRKGQLWSFRESARSFAPCLVNGNHWVGMKINAKELTIQCVNSSRNDSINDSTTRVYGNKRASFLQKVDENLWSYVGEDETFPQQVNNMDCGILVLLAARNLAVEVSMVPEMAETTNTSIWRRRFAHEILVERAS